MRRASVSRGSLSRGSVLLSPADLAALTGGEEPSDAPQTSATNPKRQSVYRPIFGDKYKHTEQTRGVRDKLRQRLRYTLVGDVDLTGKSTETALNAFKCTDDAEIKIRDLATKTGLHVLEVEKIHKRFVEFDEDGSGEIELDEFRKIVRMLLDVPEGSDSLPEDRVEQLWRTVDSDGSGSVDMYEFVLWYTKYFAGSAGSTPIENFYNILGKNRLTSSKKKAGEGEYDGSDVEE
jgi:hypothetical protein